MDEVTRAGREKLADELYDLRCEIGLVDYGEHFATPQRYAEMKARVAELEPLVGDELDRLLAADD